MTNAAGIMPVNIDWGSLPHVQDEITRWATEQFPHRTDHHAIYKLMVEEIPELAMHKKEKGTEGIGPELADCFILLLDLASLWEVDVVDAIREKMAINYRRKWNKDNNGIMQHVAESARTGPIEPVAPCCISCKSNKYTRLLTEVEKMDLQQKYGSTSDNARCDKCQITFDDDIPF